MERNSKFNETIMNLKEISKHYSAESLSSNVSALEYFKDNFNVKVLFVGHFSAGKSALINGLIGKRNFLAEAQTPQTSIASELKYTDGDEVCLVYDNDGNASQVQHDMDFDPSKYNHVEYTLNVDVLNRLSDYVIVDTPGFDSGIENHNKALANYMSQGAAFVLVSDIEKGSLDKTGLNFLNEVSNYSDKLAVILNKCDKKTDEEIEKIRDNISEDLETNDFSNVSIHCLSAYQPDISTKLEEIISGFDADIIFDNQMRRETKNCASAMLGVLTLTKKTSALDTYDLDVSIKQYETAFTNIKNKFAQLRKDANSDSCEEIAQDIIDDIRGALNRRSNEIGRALLGGSPNAAQSIILETIRPITINSIKELSTNEIDNTVQKINVELNLEDDSADSVRSIISNLTDNLKGVIENGTFDKISDQISKIKTKKSNNTIEIQNKINKSKTIYQTVTGVAAISADIIAPWLELIIVFAPDIINIISAVIKRGREQKKAAQQVQDVIIPQICEKMYEPIINAIKSSRESINANLEEIYDRELSGIEQNLQDAKEKKSKETSSYDEMMNNLDNDIETLRSIIKEMGE